MCIAATTREIMFSGLHFLYFHLASQQDKKFSGKWRWVVLDTCQAAKQEATYPALFKDAENNTKTNTYKTMPNQRLESPN